MEWSEGRLTKIPLTRVRYQRNAIQSLKLLLPISRSFPQRVKEFLN